MEIEVWSDVICPWCYIGKRHLEMALQQFPHRDSVKMVWRSFELEPDSPRNLQETLNELLVRKYHVTLEDAQEMNDRVTLAAKEAGLDYHLDIARPGNTFDAHRLQHHAAAKQLGNAASERLMRAYFSEGFPVGDHDALARLAPEFGIPEQEARDILKSDAYAQEVREDQVKATLLHITSVPYFLIDGEVEVPGARPVEVFLAALNQAWENRKG